MDDNSTDTYDADSIKFRMLEQNLETSGEVSAAFGSFAPVEPTALKALKRKSRKCAQTFSSWANVWKFMQSIVPIFAWLPHYSIKENLLGDVLGGITVAIMHVPQGIAYANLAGVPPVHGLYTSCFPALVYMIFGTSRHVSIGSFAVIALMSGVANLNVQANLEENSYVSPVEIAATLAFAIGFLQLVAGLLHLQFLTAYFSDQLVSGFTTGAAVHVLISQFDEILGIEVPNASGPGYLFMRLKDIAIRLNQASFYSVAISAVAMSFLFIGKEYLSPFIQRYTKCRITVPYELLVVILASSFSFFLNIHDRWDIPIVLSIPTGFPSLEAPEWSLLPQCLVQGLPVAIVATSIHFSMAKMLAQRFSYKIDDHQEFFALGLTSSLGSFFPIYPVSTALSRTMVNVAAGSKTLLSSLFSSILLFILILWLGHLIEPLPMCILASIITVALKPMFMKFSELKKLYSVSFVDFSVWIFSFVSTTCIDVMYGLGLSIVFQLATLIFRTQFPRWQCAVLPNREFEKPAICVFRFDSQLIFVNVERFRNALDQTLQRWDIKQPSPDVFTVDLELSNKYTKAYLILDASLITYVDFMGIKMIEELAEIAEKRNASLLLCCMNSRVRHALILGNVMPRIISDNAIFTTLADATSFARANASTDKISSSSISSLSSAKDTYN